MEERVTTLREAAEGTVQRMFCNHLGNVIDEIQRFYDNREIREERRHKAEMEALRTEMESRHKAEMEALRREYELKELAHMVDDLINDMLDGNIEYRIDWFEDEVENLRTSSDYHGTRSKMWLKNTIYSRYSELFGEPVGENKGGRGYERGGKARALLMDDDKARKLAMALLSLTLG